MGELTQYLNQILAWHSRLGTALRECLSPGLSVTEIRDQIATVPFKLPAEFVELYAWRNGTPIHSSKVVSFIEYHRFLPLDEALGRFQMTYPIIREYYGNADWMMTFEDGSGDGYGVSAVAEEAREAAPIVLLFEGEGVNTVFHSLTQMMKTMVACFEAGIFSIGEDGDLHTDFYELGQTVHKLVPDLQYLTLYASYLRPK